MAVPCNAIPLSQAPAGSSLVVSMAIDEDDVRTCQALRYNIFAEEMGANLPSHPECLDVDEFDPYCMHLMVRDSVTGQLAATTRLLLDRDARRAGMFYSETEFHLEPVLAMRRRLMEVGRTCIHRDYRNGSAISVLWAGLARVVARYEIDFLIGCASLSMSDEGAQALALAEQLKPQYLAPPALRVRPRLPLACERSNSDRVAPLPPLLKGYLRLGAFIGGEPCWDPSFNVADLFIILDRDRLTRRYARHFLGVL